MQQPDRMDRMDASSHSAWTIRRMTTASCAEAGENKCCTIRKCLYITTVPVAFLSYLKFGIRIAGPRKKIDLWEEFFGFDPLKLNYYYIDLEPQNN